MAVQWQVLGDAVGLTSAVEMLTLRVARATLPQLAHITEEPELMHACTDTQWYSQAGWVWRDADDLMIGFTPINNADYLGRYGEPIFTYRK